MKKPYFAELMTIEPGNDLYASWIKYAINLTDADIKDIVENGLTYQANALQSMIKEIIAGGAVSNKLLHKLEQLSMQTKLHADKLR